MKNDLTSHPFLFSPPGSYLTQDIDHECADISILPKQKRIQDPLRFLYPESWDISQEGE